MANVYGPRDFDRAIPIFIDKAIKGDDLIVYGGNQVLDFVYIYDVIDAFVKAIDINESYILNISSGKRTTILDLAELIIKITKSNSSIQIKEKRKGEVDKFVANISRVNEVLKWKPKTELMEELKALIKHYQK